MKNKYLRIIENCKGKHLIILLITSTLLASFIISMGFGLFPIPAEASLDSLNHYTSEVFYNNIDGMEDIERRNYLIIHLVDYIFMWSFAGIFFVSMAILIKKLKSSSYYSILNKLPIVALIYLLTDLIENLTIDSSILSHPNINMTIGTIAGYATFIKMNTVYVIGIIILILILWHGIRYLKTRTNR